MTNRQILHIIVVASLRGIREVKQHNSVHVPESSAGHVIDDHAAAR